MELDTLNSSSEIWVMRALNQESFFQQGNCYVNIFSILAENNISFISCQILSLVTHYVLATRCWCCWLSVSTALFSCTECYAAEVSSCITSFSIVFCLSWFSEMFKFVCIRFVLCEKPLCITIASKYWFRNFSKYFVLASYVIAKYFYIYEYLISRLHKKTITKNLSKRCLAS